MLDAFLREIPSEHGLISVVLAEGSPQVSVYSGPFSWQIDLRDLTPVINLLGRVINDRQHAQPPVRLVNGEYLHIGIGVGGTHCWISSCDAHLRIDATTVAPELLAYLSEARAFMTRLAAQFEHVHRAEATATC
jgi:hypothetical protein